MKWDRRSPISSAVCVARPAPRVTQASSDGVRGAAGLEADPDRARHYCIQSFAFEYQTLDELLGTYKRLKRQVGCCLAGEQNWSFSENSD
jgi:hypothetical protein